MASVSPGPGGSGQPISALEAQALGPSLEEGLERDSDSQTLEFGSVGGGVGRPAQEELSGSHCGTVEVQAGEMEPRAPRPAKQTAEGKTVGGRKSELGAEAPEVRRSERNKQKQQNAAELTPGAAEEGTGGVSTKPPVSKAKKSQGSVSVGASPSGATVGGEATLNAKGASNRKKQDGGKAVSQLPVGELQLPSSPCKHHFWEPNVFHWGGEYVVPETPLEACAAGESPVGKEKADYLSQSGRIAAEVSQAGESNSQDPAGNETPEPNSQLNPSAAKLSAATRGNVGSPAVSVGSDTSSGAGDSDGEQESQGSTDSHLHAKCQPTAQKSPDAPTDGNPQAPSHKDIVPLLQELNDIYKVKGKKEAAIVAQRKLIKAANNKTRGRLELDLITLKGELFEIEVSIERLLSKAGPWRETFENREHHSASSDTEGEFKRPQAPAKKAPPKGKRKDAIHWQQLAFNVQEEVEQEKKQQQQREEFNVTQEDFPPLSPGAQPAHPKVAQGDPVAPIPSNSSAASGMSGVVHGGAVGMSEGAPVLAGVSAHRESVVMGAQGVSGSDGNKTPKQSVTAEGRDGRAQAGGERQQGQNPRGQQPGEQASTSGADGGTSGNFWERRRFFPAGEGPSFGGQAFRRQNCVKLVWGGKKEEAPKRTYVIRTLLEKSAKFKTSDLEACIVQSPTEWDNQPEWKNFDAIPVSRPETKNITIIVKNEGVPVNDVVLWLKRQCTLLAPLTRVCEDDVWTGGWKTEVELKVVDNVPQHLPNTFFIGKEKCICFYAGQSRRCFKCGSLNHLASSCLVERCAYCGKIGHTKKVCKIIKCNLCGKEGHPHRLCPKAWHNNNGQKGNMAEQEEDQLMFEAVQEVEQQCREELRQKPEAAKANQAQREVPVGDQSSKGRKAQSQEGSSNGQRVDDQRSSPQAGPSQAKKGLSEAPTTPPNAPDPKQQLSISRAASPQQSQEISLSPAPPLQEHPKKRKKKNKKNKRSSEQVDADSPEVGGWQFVKSSGKRSPGVMTFPETSNRYAQLQIEGDDSGEDDSNEDDSWGSIMEEEYQRMEKEVSLEQSAQQSAAFSQSTPRGGGTISADVGCSNASSEVVGPTISQPEVDLVTDVEVIPLGDEDPIPAGVQIKRFGEEVCEEEREGKKAKFKNQHGYVSN
ncbi:hypothetical protein XENTR_v10015728 [Xenopus tropicalis]|nr:hypothetical protein XENTR_v10015728 [Xenopus tropicalis]